MFRFMTRIVKWTVIGGLCTWAFVALIGPGRVKAAFWTLQDHLRSHVDEMVDTKVALQHQIRKLRQDYPEKIANLRIQLEQVNRDLTANERDRRVADEVVALCRSDAKALSGKLATARTQAADGTVYVEFRARQLDREQVTRQANHIAQTEKTYQDRESDLGQEHKLLLQQRDRVQAALRQTQEQYEAFKTQVGEMLREVDMITRKEDLVKIAEQCRSTVTDLQSDQSDSLSALKQKIEKRRIQLDERLKALDSFPASGDYEARAKLRLMSPAGSR